MMASILMTAALLTFGIGTASAQTLQKVGDSNKPMLKFKKKGPLAQWTYVQKAIKNAALDCLAIGRGVPTAVPALALGLVQAALGWPVLRSDA